MRPDSLFTNTGMVTNSPQSQTQTSTQPTSVVGNRKRKQQLDADQVAKAAKINTTVTVGSGIGQTINVTMIPTSNTFAGLKETDGNDEIIMKNNQQPRQAKVRVPPIAVFNSDRVKVIDLMKALNVTKFSLKSLRHSIHLYVEAAEDFKKVRERLNQDKISNYSHDLREERYFKVALKGLHKMNVDELRTELKDLQLEPVDIRIITPRNPRNPGDIVYIISYKAATVKLRDLRQTARVLFHTIVQWEAYQRKSDVVQCIRCQRPGHGARNCNMPPRCNFCGDAHLSDKCPIKKARLEKIQTAMETNQTSTEKVEVELPSRCCNCNAEGHFASDPKCPKKLAYIQARREKSSSGRTNVKQHNPSRMTGAASGLVKDGVSFAEILKSGKFPSGDQMFSQSDKTRHSGSQGSSSKLGPSGARGPSGKLGPSGTLDSSSSGERPFSVEEITALTMDIVSSLRNVRNLPRHEAFMAVMNVAFKYLYDDV